MSLGKSVYQTEKHGEVRLTCGSSHLHHTKKIAEMRVYDKLEITLHDSDKDKVTVWCSICGSTIWTNVV
jgi:hypothetical protein